MSTILQGRPLITTKPFLRRAEHCMGKVVDAPASADSKVCSCCREEALVSYTEENLRACNNPSREDQERIARSSRSLQSAVLHFFSGH